MEYGILVVESEDGQYQIIGPVDSLSEAKEIAQNYHESWAGVRLSCA